MWILKACLEEVRHTDGDESIARTAPNVPKLSEGYSWQYLPDKNLDFIEDAELALLCYFRDKNKVLEQKQSSNLLLDKQQFLILFDGDIVVACHCETSSHCFKYLYTNMQERGGSRRAGFPCATPKYVCYFGLK